MASELSRRANGNDLPVPNISRTSFRELMTIAGDEGLAMDLNAMLARREVWHVKSYYQDRAEADGEVAHAVERVASQSETGRVLAASTAAEYERVVGSIGPRRFMTGP